ncbi:MAG: molybdopterin-guanine dinucleotide biosynthesis protein B [Deltaproteobacteria bacterium]|nr:molybdopterin-guanine dinucleotide biosynthesis protein B [Deltaproteobacteria bacterium]
MKKKSNALKWPTTDMTVKYVSFVGRSNSGKTTLITRLIPVLRDRNIKIGTIKHTHHAAEFDKAGKDSWRHRQAGSEQVVLHSQNQLVLYTDQPSKQSLAETVERWFGEFDLVISEGFKNEAGLKIEVYRESTGKQPLYVDPEFDIQAIVSDTDPDISITVFDFEELEALSDWIIKKTDLKPE